MPNLPTISVTDAQLSRITATFGSAANYRAWLKQQIKEAVFQKEADEIMAAAQEQIKSKRSEVDDDLGAITT